MMAKALANPPPGSPLEPWLAGKVSMHAAPAVRDRLLAAGSLVAALAQWLMGDSLPANERDGMTAPARKRVDGLWLAGMDADSPSADEEWQRAGMAAAFVCWLIDGDGAAWRASDPTVAPLVQGLAGMHELWEPQFSELGPEHALGHPVWPLADAWLNALRPALEANDREHSVMVLDVRDMHDRGDDAHDLLPNFGGGGPGPVPEGEGAYLRGLPQLPPLESSRVTIPAALMMYDRSGMAPATKGRGAPLVLRLFHNALLATPTEGRDGDAHLIPFKAEDLISMTHKAGNFRHGRHWPVIRTELRRVSELRVQLPPEDGQTVGRLLSARLPAPRAGRPSGQRRMGCALASLTNWRAVDRLHGAPANTLGSGPPQCTGLQGYAWPVGALGSSTDKPATLAHDRAVVAKGATRHGGLCDRCPRASAQVSR